MHGRFTIGLPILLASLAAASGCANSGAHQHDVEQLEVERVVLANLGEEHIRNTAYRQAPGGDGIVAWGNRIVEWKMPGTSDLIERVPPRGDIWYSNGGVTLDVDADGGDELVVGRTHTKAGTETTLVWYEEKSDGSWLEHEVAKIEHGRRDVPHDIQPLRLGEPGGGVVALIGRRELLFFEIPDDPRSPWIRRDIARLPASRQSGLQVGDVNGDGRDDLAVGMFWVEAPTDFEGGSWKVHRFGTYDANDWGGMAKHGLADFDRDGDMEIVATEAEIPGARLGFFDSPRGEQFNEWTHTLIDSALYCPHSLIVADLNEDSRPDLVIGEMTAGGWDFPMNENPQIVAYLQDGDGAFRRVVLQENVGVHEMRIAPVRIDGRHVLYAADEIQPQKFEGMETHVSYWLVGLSEDE